jgi:hypothetical protein
VAEAQKARGAAGNGISLTTALGSGINDVRALNNELKGLTETGSRFAALGGGLIGLLKNTAVQLAGIAGVSLGAAAAFGTVKKAIQSYAESEDALVSMQLALAAQGKYSKEAAEGIAQLAGEFEKSTGIGDSHWLAQFTKLIQYGGRTENIDQLANTLKNLDGIMGGDLDGAANLMIRALNGSYRGFEQLGFSIDKNKTALENWKSIVEQTQRGAGILEKQADTLTGTFNRWSIAFDNFTKAGVAGVSLQTVLKTALEQNIQRLTYWADKVGIAIPQVKGLTNASSVLTRTTDDLAQSQDAARDRLKAMGDAAEAAAKKLDQVKAAIRQMHQQDDSEADARMELELALVDDEEKRTGNALGASRKRFGIKSRYARDKAHSRQLITYDIRKFPYARRRRRRLISDAREHSNVLGCRPHR